MAKSEALGSIDLYKSMGDLTSARELYLQDMAFQVCWICNIYGNKLDNYKLCLWKMYEK